ncbi:MAG: chemotaxis protein CheW [Rhodospirillales bacterium]|nr:MAG: chemotaxis protein CheW [Rhodospirillales bacterium]
MATVATIADTAIVGDNEDQLVTMVVDDQLFGIPILQVQDIVEASKITPVPLAPSAIAGVLNLRGRIVTVIDLRKLLGNDEEVPWESQMGVTVDYKGDLYTLLVDAIGDVRTLPKHDFDKAPSTMHDNIRRLCSGIYRLRNNLLVVLDVARILQTEIIEATPMLTVEERRNRKSAAMAQSDGSSSRGHQLSTLMSDLNAYESETDGTLGAASDAGDDDMKARRQANRQRRPIAERWQEVLEEKARKMGQPTYRMREPHEEIIEQARSEMAKEDAEWASRVLDSSELLPEGADDVPASEAAGDEQLPVVPQQDTSDMKDGLPHPPDDIPAPADTGPIAPEERPRGSLDAHATPDDGPEPPKETSGTQRKQPLDLGAAPSRPADDIGLVPSGPAESEPTGKLAADEPEAEGVMPQDTAMAGETSGDAVDHDAADLPPPDNLPELPADSRETESTRSSPDPETGGTAPSAREVGGITGGWWNKLRARTGVREDSESAPPDAAAADEPDKSATPAKKTATAKSNPAKAKKPAKPRGKSTATGKKKAAGKSKTSSKPKG